MAADDLSLLTLDLEALFVMSPTGRIAAVNSPDGEPGPRLLLAGCRAGNLLRLRWDVGDETARGVAALAAGEPPWFDPAAPPLCQSAIIALLSREAPAERIGHAIIYRLPHGLRCGASARLVAGDEPEGRALVDRLDHEGAPPALVDAGFLSGSDFWPPWCAALVGGEIAAVAFAARLSSLAAEVGVYTFAGYRGQGLAAAVTARWSSLAGLADRRLFYSASTTNRSSQRVAERLGLARLGASLAVS
jgi:hypothetical protein